MIEWRTTRAAELERELAAATKGTDEYAKPNETAIINKMVLDTLESGLELTYPTRTFSKSMTLVADSL